MFCTNASDFGLDVQLKCQVCFDPANITEVLKNEIGVVRLVVNRRVPGNQDVEGLRNRAIT